MQRVSMMLFYKSLHPRKVYEQKFMPRFNAMAKRRRLLLLSLAIRAYQLETGQPPKNLAELSPVYLKAIPRDPFTGTNLAYTLPAR